MKSLSIRSRIVASALAATAVVGLGVSAMGNTVFAATAQSRPPAEVVPSQTNPAAAQPASVGTKKQTLVGTYIESGNGDGETLSPETQVALDPLNRVTCPSGETCTITDTISVQLVDHNKDVSSLYCMPWQVDGTPAGEQGPFVGETSTDGLLTGDTWTDQQPGVAAGKHTVQSFVFSQKGASLASWTVTYSVYD
jgi:hypothetical protein